MHWHATFLDKDWTQKCSQIFWQFNMLRICDLSSVDIFLRMLTFSDAILPARATSRSRTRVVEGDTRDEWKPKKVFHFSSFPSTCADYTLHVLFLKSHDNVQTTLVLVIVVFAIEKREWERVKYICFMSDYSFTRAIPNWRHTLDIKVGSKTAKVSELITARVARARWAFFILFSSWMFKYFGNELVRWHNGSGKKLKIKFLAQKRASPLLLHGPVNRRNLNIIHRRERESSFFIIWTSTWANISSENAVRLRFF